MSFAAAAIWALLALFLWLFVVGVTEDSRAGAATDLASRTGCLALAYSLVLFGILRVHEPEGSVRHVLAVRRTPVLAVVLALLVGVALSLPSEWINNALEARFPTPLPEQEQVDRVLSVATLGKRITLPLTLVIAEPILDELFFRGALFTPLRRTQRAESVVIATVAFETLGSASPRAMLSLFAARVVFSWLRGSTGSVVPSIVARMGFFGLAVVPMALGRDSLAPTPRLLAASAVALVLGLLGIHALGRRDSLVSEARTADGAS